MWCLICPTPLHLISTQGPQHVLLFSPVGSLSLRSSLALSFRPLALLFSAPHAVSWFLENALSFSSLLCLERPSTKTTSFSPGFRSYPVYSVASLSLYLFTLSLTWHLTQNESLATCSCFWATQQPPAPPPPSHRCPALPMQALSW